MEELTNYEEIKSSLINIAKNCEGEGGVSNDHAMKLLHIQVNVAIAIELSKLRELLEAKEYRAEIAESVRIWGTGDE